MNNTLLKPLVHRARPFDAWTDLTALVARPGGSSFPSGHTGAAFAFAWTFFRTQPKQLGIPVLFAAALMGFSRLYVGVHYPTDVLAGALVGIGVGEVMVQLGKRKRKDEEITA
jgi:undecaprenyl-diphosphatase